MRMRDPALAQAISEFCPHEPAHLSVIGGVFIVIRYTVAVCYSEFGGCSLFWSRRCIAFTGIAVGTSMVVCYTEEVIYWEGPLLEIPLYICIYTVKSLLADTPNSRHLLYSGQCTMYQVLLPFIPYLRNLQLADTS